MHVCAGMWTKDMKTRSNLTQPQITKILKTLESRDLIKSVKSVSNASRKVYMLFDLVPSAEITGGAWCVGLAVEFPLGSAGCMPGVLTIRVMIRLGEPILSCYT